LVRVQYLFKREQEQICGQDELEILDVTIVNEWRKEHNYFLVITDINFVKTL